MTRSYSFRPLSDMDPAARLGSKFYVHLAGNTQDAHLPWVRKLERHGQTQVFSPQESDYLMVFCPIASRIGTDIAEALANLPRSQKQVFLVVMHHTFNPEHVVVESSRQVDRPFVVRTVDCLFHSGRLLDCSRNEIAWNEVETALGFPPSAVSPSWNLLNWVKTHMRACYGIILVIAAVAGVITLICWLNKRDNP